MKRRAFLALLVLPSLLAKSAITVQQLVSFVRSSIQLKHPDRQVAGYLRTVKLAERLDERTIIELQADGAGPQTVAALRSLMEASRSLPAPVAQAAPQAAAVIPPPDAEEIKRIIAETREYALNYTRQLPNFICTQVIRRYVDPSGLEFWQLQDTLTARLSYFEQKEDYKLYLVNGVYTDMPYDAVGGTTTRGEFGSMMREIFDPATEAAFQWERWTTLRGRRTHVFSYQVEQSRSLWRLAYEGYPTLTLGYHGSVYVDRDTGMVTRITLEADGIPPGHPVTQVLIVLDYDYAKIGDHEYLLPMRTVVRSREGRLLKKNEIEFRLYRRFSAEATITFDTPAPLPEERTTEEPPKP